MQRGNYARLTQLATVAVEAGYEVPREFTSLKARERAQEARYPARQINKIWHFDPADIDVIAPVLGFSRKAA
jgi:hypothetical protein